VPRRRRQTFSECYLFVRHRSDADENGEGLRTTLYGTDGTNFRRIRSEGDHVTYASSCAPSSANHLVELVAGAWSCERELLGYAALSRAPCVGIVRYGDRDSSTWAAVELDRDEVRRRMARNSGDGLEGVPTSRIAGAGTLVGPNDGGVTVEAALETKGNRYLASGRRNVLDDLTSSTLWAARCTGQSGRRVPREDLADIGVQWVPLTDPEPLEPERVSGRRVHLSFPLKRLPWTLAQGKTDAIDLWVELTFNADLVDVPVHWRRVWMRLSLQPA